MEMYKRSVEDPAGFWSDIAWSEFYWKEKWGQQVFSENLDVRKGNINIEVLLFVLFYCTFSFEFFFLMKVNLALYSESVFGLCVISQWFKGGVTNICYNCLDRNVEAGNGDKIALYWEGNELGVDGTLTYTQLLHSVCQVIY